MENKRLQIIAMFGKHAVYSLIFLSSVLNLILAKDGRTQSVLSVKEAEITINMENASVEQVFREVERKSAYSFVYNHKNIDDKVKISVNINGGSLEKLLLSISQQANLGFRQVNDKISVKPLISNEDQERVEISYIQEIVTGTVTDPNGEVLIGVSVLIKGTTNGTITDVNGAFSLEIPSDETTLVFSYVGYVKKEVKVGTNTVVNVVMSEDLESLDEVIVVGYGTQEKNDLTGSAIRADIESFRESPNVNIAQSLQGSVPGLSIGQTDAAGANPSISIRGATTINGNQNVLLVVDGIIYTGGLNDLNPNDIASIDVLKDASSMAIFGAQAANGVILITTKTGSQSGKPVFNFTTSYTTQNPSNSLSLNNREEFINNAYDIDWEIAFQAPEYTQRDQSVDYSNLVADPELRNGYENGNNFDWWDEATNPGFISSNNLSVRGKSGDVSYFLAGGYTKQKGYIINDAFERVTTRINLENNIFDWFKIGAQTFATFSDYSGDSPTLNNVARMTPLVKPYDDNGEIILNPNGANIPNPFLNSEADDFDKRNSLFGNFYLDLDMPFLEGLNFRLNYGHNYRWNRRYNSNVYDNGASGGATKTNNHAYDWTIDNILNYKRTIADVHSIDVTLVAGRRERKFEETRSEGINFNNLGLSYNDLSLAAIQNIYSDAWDESYLYQMARVNYEFAYKYLVTGTVRRDGFSGFAKNQKTALFPSIGIGWIVSEESFLPQGWIENLKLRASYGSNGNLVDRYASLARLSTFPAYVFGDGGSTVFGQQVQNLANPNLTWESTTGLNFGVDFSVLNNRFSGSIDYYNTTTNDLIFQVSLPEITGFNQIISNVGEVDNQGLEFLLNSKIVEKDDFNWNINFNISSNKNRIQSLINLDADNDGTEDDLVASGLFIGESINAIYDYESAGIIQLGDEVPNGFFVGTHRIVDQNADDFIDPNDRVILGREEPAFRFGILNEFNYKEFTLRFFVNSIQGGKDGYLGRNMLDGFGSGDNIRRNNMWREFDYWVPSNPDARYRRLDQEPSVDYIFYGDRSFVRLQDVTLAYAVKSEFVERIGFKSAKVYISGKNLITLTKWEGWDPETGDGFSAGGRPVLKGLSFGLDVSF